MNKFMFHFNCVGYGEDAEAAFQNVLIKLDEDPVGAFDEDVEYVKSDLTEEDLCLLSHVENAIA